MANTKSLIKNFRNAVNIIGLIGLLCIASYFYGAIKISACKWVFLYSLAFLSGLNLGVLCLGLAWNENISRDLFKLISNIAVTILVYMHIKLRNTLGFWIIFGIVIAGVSLWCMLTTIDDDNAPVIIRIFQVIAFIAFSLAYVFFVPSILFFVTLVISLSFLCLIIAPYISNPFGEIVVTYSEQMGAILDINDNFVDIKEKTNSHNGYFCYHPRGQTNFIEASPSVPVVNSLYLLIMHDGTTIYSRNTRDINQDISDLYMYGIILDKHIRAILLIKDWVVIDYLKPAGMEIYLGNTYYNAKNDFTVFNYIYMNGTVGNTGTLKIHPMSDIMMVYDDEADAINSSPNNIVPFAGTVNQYYPNLMPYSTHINLLAIGALPAQFALRTYSNHTINLAISTINIIIDVLDQSGTVVRSQTLSKI